MSVKLILLFFICLRCTLLSAGSNTVSTGGHLFAVKCNIFNLTQLFNHSIRVGLEYFPASRRYTIEPELGYFIYSKEEELRCKGFHYALSWGTVTRVWKHWSTVKFQGFYDRILINGYLKSESGYFSYIEYKKTDYVKERYGLNIVHGRVFDISKRFILESDIGMGIIHYTTLVPDGVIQHHYNNGFSTNSKVFIAHNTRKFTHINFIAELKFGYRF